ncbi:hypothetical protein K4H00_21780, partial [Mycobacterium tuberculosis]|nr:hypothetical protein [Mycobacterium tuberculosis]
YWGGEVDVCINSWTLSKGLWLGADVDGIVGAIRLRPGSGTRATILGAGATARSALLALVRLGITEVDLLVRSASRAVAAAELGTRLGLAVEIG